ncbi:5'-3' exonuclease [Lederbergia lenta]|uniref:5'-3' exonuclease n=1 Tax=Lederbergia lenta TaxID=1467 RepID=UPI00203E254F|nr:5'-3' exonuclease H3TH domain-containing protein [Lederbergia lenta]MCM3109327.1 5'-3' exonuclease [Lederbergia lenta]
MKQQHLLLIDGMALLFRSFYATAVSKYFMVNTAGVPTNAVQGYIKHLLMAVEHVNPTHVAVCWDMGSVTFRNDLYPEYKANRGAAPEELIPQFDLAKEVTTAFNIPNIGIAGFEADDCIGTICEQYKDQMNISVLTGDRDLIQIVDENVQVLIMQKGMGNYKTYTTSLVWDEFNILPKQLIDVKALMGDSSDGYPGVKGIGEKTALKLIQTYDHIEGLLENIAHITPGQRKKIEAETEVLHLCRALAKIKCDTPLLQININDCTWEEVPSTAWDAISEHELKTIHSYLLKSSMYSGAGEIFSS